MRDRKKVYTPPIMEPILLAPSEDIADNFNIFTWSDEGWQSTYFNNASVIQATGQWVWNEDGTITK